MNKSSTATVNVENTNVRKNKIVSFFEFWPLWVMYFPVAIQWLLLSIRYRSLTLPLIANPSLTLSGMVGATKSELMKMAGPQGKRSILNWSVHELNEISTEVQLGQWQQRFLDKGIQFPLVCKPDIGCRGSGVKKVENAQQLLTIMRCYPKETRLLVQKLAKNRPEVGIFFVKNPNTNDFSIVSLTFKESPTIVGDGQHTISELILSDGRASKLKSVYFQRHKKHLNRVLDQGELFPLVFSASHCRGAIFKDARQHITQALTDKIATIINEFPDLNYGRLDVKYEDLQSLKQGKNLEIIEINGASAEMIHIWDKDSRFSDALKTLLWQYRTLFKIGDMNRLKGHKTPGIKSVLKHWRLERSLAKYYPETD